MPLRSAFGRALCCALCAAPVFAQGKLDAVRDRVHGEALEHAFDDDGGLELIVDVLDLLIEVPFRMPCVWLGDDDLDPAGFQRYPNEDGDGYWLPASDGLAGERWSLRPRAEWGTDFDDLRRRGVGLELEHASRFGLDGTWSRWREDLGGAAADDELDLGDANLTLRFAQGPHAAFRIGAGLNYLEDERDLDLGFNFTYGIDFLPGGPLSAVLESDAGTLGDATFLHFRGALGVVWTRFELYASLDWFEIQGVSLDSYGFGLRAWF